MRHLLLVAITSLLVGCAAGGEPTPTTSASTPAPGVTSPLPPIDLAGMRPVSCGDAIFFFVNETGTELVTIDLPGLATRATEAATMISETHEAGEATVTLRLGAHLEQLACNDAIEFDPVISTEITATAGTIGVVARPDLSNLSPMGTALTIVDLEITALQFGELTVSPDTHTTDGLDIGWFVG